MCVPRYIVGVNYIFNKNGGVWRSRRGTVYNRAVSRRNWQFARKKKITAFGLRTGTTPRQYVNVKSCGLNSFDRSLVAHASRPSLSGAH